MPRSASFCADVGILQRFDHGAVQRLDDVLRRAGRRYEAVPGGRFEARKPRLVHGRNVRQDRGALERRHRERAELTVLEKAHHARGGGEHHLVVARHDVLERRRRALIGHMHDVDMRRGLEQFAGEMRREPIARGGVVELARIGLGEIDQFLQRMRRHAEIDHEHVRLRADQADRVEILLGIEADLFVEAAIGGQDGIVAQQDGVAIGRRMGHDLARDIAAGARPIVDHERLAEQTCRASR